MSIGLDTLNYRFASGASYELVYHVPAIILYPSLATPAILVGSQKLEILILGKENYPLTMENINWQLKITKGLDEKKSYYDKPLFSSNAEQHITIDPGKDGHSGDFEQTVLNGEILLNREGFAGLLDERAFDLFSKEVKYNQIYRVGIENVADVENIPDSSGLEKGLYNLFWLYAPTKPQDPSSLQTLNEIRDGKLHSNELHDTVIQSVLQELNGPRINNTEGGRYCFKVDEDDIDLTKMNLQNPIQAYHPLAYYPEGTQYLNIGQLADLHICARQNVMCKSPARVIEYPFEEPVSTPPESGSAAAAAESPPESDETSNATYDIYTIVSGDWLSKIAQRYGMTWRELWNYDGGTGIPNKNRLRSGDPDLIYPGEEIVVPPSGGGDDETEPCIGLSTTTLAFVATEEGENPEPQSVEITNSGDGSLNWTASKPSQPWLSAQPRTGTAPSTMMFSVEAAGLERGSYTDSVVISATEATNTPQTITITLTVGPPSKATEVSPEIGSMTGVSSRNIKELLDKIGADAGIQVLFLSGDLIDYVKSYFPEPDKTVTTVKQIWDEVDLDDDSWEERYQDYVDYISIYSLIVYFCRRYGKPVFVISGNHDCYGKPYGISPRLSAPMSWFEKRPNEGIPADHNLTFYEAILAFGESYGELKFSLLAGIFEKEKLKWLYSVLTPFADFVVPTPTELFVGLAWGDEEDSIDVPSQGQGVGHLPRSDDAVSDKQLQLLQGCISGRKIILTTHFTFASWKESVPMLIPHKGEIDIGDWAIGSYSHYNMGTFETNRKALFEQQLGSFKIPVVLSGHSHRRGLYAITDWGGGTVTTTYSDFDGANVSAVPLLLVPDSAGPLPRFNQKDELKQYGSDRAAAAKVVFNSGGTVQAVNVIQTKGKPRFIVSLDYYDILRDRVITKFETDEFSIRDEQMDRVTYAFGIYMLKSIVELVYLESVTMYSYGPDGVWRQIQLRYDGVSRWVIDRSGDCRVFRKIIARCTERSNFLSMKFRQKSELVAHYDLDYRWNFEFQVDDDKSGGWPWKRTRKKYIIERDEDYAEIPDFEWRKKFGKYQ